MRVLLAGGGTAGHTSPLLATADALRRSTRRSRSPASAPRGAREPRWSPRPGYPLELCRRCRCRASPAATCCRSRPGCAPSAAALEIVDRVKPDVVVGFGGYVSVPAYLAARRAASRSWSTRATPCPASPTSSVPASRRTSRSASRTRPCARREYVGLPIRRMISTLDRGRAAGRGARGFGLDPTGRRCWSPAARRAPAAQPVRLRCRRGARRSRRPGAARVGPKGEARRGGQPGGPPTSCCPTSTGWTSPTPPPTSVLCRCGANTVTEASGVGPARGLRAAADRQRRAGAQRRAGRRRRRRPAGRRRRPDARRGSPTTVPPLLTDPAARRDGRSRRRRDPARRRRQARRPSSSRPPLPERPMRIPVPEVLLPAEELGRVHFVGIGGAGLSGIARIMLARGIAGQRQRRQDSPARRAARARRPRARRPRRRSRARRDTLVVSTAIREDNPEYVEAVAARACGSCRGRPAWR
jgi:UDP-N-acetylglucosamine--N-acetylmuramyl-(pentapeptide) pyrophosphoryl-undecaprenol N-acetylglucosamine transferase